MKITKKLRKSIFDAISRGVINVWNKHFPDWKNRESPDLWSMADRDKFDIISETEMEIEKEMVKALENPKGKHHVT
jgi:hypothetical protein